MPAAALLPLLRVAVTFVVVLIAAVIHSMNNYEYHFRTVWQPCIAVAVVVAAADAVDVLWWPLNYNKESGQYVKPVKYLVWERLSAEWSREFSG